MDNPQYYTKQLTKITKLMSFKPYYKWITLNTRLREMTKEEKVRKF